MTLRAWRLSTRFWSEEWSKAALLFSSFGPRCFYCLLQFISATCVASHQSCAKDFAFPALRRALEALAFGYLRAKRLQVRQHVFHGHSPWAFFCRNASRSA